MTNKLSIVLLCGTSVAAFAFAAPVMAQSEPQAAQSGGVEEIVVTAQRRTERLENVPMAMTVLNSDALEKASIVSFDDLGKITPGVILNRGGAYVQPSIRGITALTNGTGNENNVAIYVDGFFVSDGQSIDSDLPTVSDVQVLKGPQGALYGRQAAGGAILINTLDPTRELSGRFEGGYGRFKDRRLKGYISGPLSDSLFFLASGAYRNTDGYTKLASRTNPRLTNGPAAPNKQRSIRTKLLWEASDTLSATLAYNYNFNSNTLGGSQYTVRDYIPPTSLQLVNLQYGFYTYAYNNDPFMRTSSNEVTLKVEWKTDIGTLTSRTGQRWQRNRTSFDFDGGFADLIFSDGLSRQKTFQESLDWNIDAIENLDLIIGGMYFKDKYYPGPGEGGRNFGPNLTLTQLIERRTGTKAWAFFADATYHMTDKLTFNVGGRYNIDKKTLGLFSVFGPAYETTNAQKTFKKFTPRATIRYEVADRSNVYASFSQGYKAGSFNANGSAVRAIASVPIRPEVVTAYEIGFKTARRMFRFETSAFYYDYKDINISLTTTNPLGPQFGAATIIGNAPKSKIYGIDFQIAAEPFDRMNVVLGGTWLHARYGNFKNASGVGVNATNTLNVNQPNQDWSGIQMARAPNFSANLALDYTVDVADGDLRLSGNAAYTTSYVPSNPSVFGPLAPAALQRKQRFRQGSNVQLGGEIRWTDPTDHYWVGVYGTNLTNVKTKLAWTGTGSGNYYYAGPPIQYGVKAGYKF